MDYTKAFIARWLLFPNSLDVRQNTLKWCIAIIMLLTIIRYCRFLYPKHRAQRAGYLPWQELMPNPWFESGWLALYQSREDQAYITTMSIDVATFDYILQAGFKAAWDNRPIRRNNINPLGRPRRGQCSLDAPGALGLLLHYLCSTANGTSLEMIFVIIPTTLSRYIETGIPILFEVLQKIPEAMIKWPTPDQMELYAAYINTRHPKIDGAFGFIDGLHVPVGASGDMLTENAMWSRWLHLHSISNIIVFAPDGVY
ncbi:hypothetical protein FRC10_003845 [Ceratobasidium sp. 414]|nr:hypothetical protein FRC10_003845 [Ceratobasidium sp. 414]